MHVGKTASASSQAALLYQVNKAPTEVLRQQTRLALQSRRFSEEVVRTKSAELAETNAAIAKLQQELKSHLTGHSTDEDKSALKEELQPLETETADMLLTVSEQSADVYRAKHQVQLAQLRAHCHNAARANAEVSAHVCSTVPIKLYPTMFLDCSSK